MIHINTNFDCLIQEKLVTLISSASSPQLNPFPSMATSDSSSSHNQLQSHFVLFPLMAQGHMIPMIDLANLLAHRHVFVTFVTTPFNATRFQSFFSQAKQSSLPISLLQIPFPSLRVGLPLGCENLDVIPSPSLLRKFFTGLCLLQQPLEHYLEQQPPSCIVSDKYIYWTSDTAHKFQCPRIVFHGMGCFSLLSSHNILLHGSHNSVNSDTEPFSVPGLPRKIEITRAQLPGSFLKMHDLDDFRDKVREAELKAYGVVVNSCIELEDGCCELYEDVISQKVWCVGPVSISNRTVSNMFERGDKASINQSLCLNWLDSMEPESVIYACLGSLCRLVPSQLIQLGLSLESSNHPFIWVFKIKDEDDSSELEKWLLEERFEERINGRGLIIRGWAPQLMILSHSSIRGFLTHCGWNSTIEGISNGLPMITWPQFAEQFLNEKLVVEILKIGVRVGVEGPVRFGEEEKVGVMVKESEILKAIEMMMDGGEEGEGRRKRARELGKMAAKAMENGGSSYLNLSVLIKDVMEEYAHLKG